MTSVPERAASVSPIEGASPRQVELLRLAYRLMATRGIQRLTLQDVADAGGMSKGNVVHHYKTKEDLVLTSMQWVLEGVASRIVEATSAAVGRDAKIRAMIDAIFVDPQRNRNFYIVYAELIAHSSRNERFAALNNWFRDIMNGQYAIVIGGPTGHAEQAVAESAMVVRALIDGLFLQWLEESNWEARHSEYRELCVRSIIAFLGE